MTDSSRRLGKGLDALIPQSSEGGVALFRYDDTTAVRVVMIDGEPWFVLADLTKALGLTQFRTDRLDDGVIRNHPIPDRLGRIQNPTIVSEPGMYEVVLRSDKPEAIAFRRWLTGTVLPEIRKTGSFNRRPELSRDEQMALGLVAAQQLLAEKTAEIAELSPKAEKFDLLLSADGDWDVSEAAGILHRAGVIIGEIRLFDYLHEIRWTFRTGKKWRVHQYAKERGWLAEKPQGEWTNPETGEVHVRTPQVRVTPKGVDRLVELLTAKQVAQ